MRCVLSIALGCLLALAPGCSSAVELTPEQRAEIAEVDHLIQLYVKGDPSWPTARQKALGDPNKAGLLIDRFIYAMDSAWRRERPVGVLLPASKSGRLQAELIAMAPTSIPFLIIGLSDRRDRVANKWVADTLARIGPPALPALRASYGESEVPAERSRILATIAKMDALSELDFVLAQVEDPAWQVRGQALFSAGQLASRRGVSEPERARAREVLRQRLEDSDRFVRRKAAEGLGEIGDPAAVRILLERFEKLSAVNTIEDLKERSQVLITLQRATGLLESRHIEDFERWIARREGER